MISLKTIRGEMIFTDKLFSIEHISFKTQLSLLKISNSLFAYAF